MSHSSMIIFFISLKYKHPPKLCSSFSDKVFLIISLFNLIVSEFIMLIAPPFLQYKKYNLKNK